MRLLHALLVAALGGGAGRVRALGIAANSSLTTDYSGTVNILYTAVDNSYTFVGDLGATTTISILPQLDVTINELASTLVTQMYVQLWDVSLLLPTLMRKA